MDVEVNSRIFIFDVLGEIELATDLVHISVHRFGLRVPIVILHDVIGSHSAGLSVPVSLSVWLSHGLVDVIFRKFVGA